MLLVKDPWRYDDVLALSQYEQLPTEPQIRVRLTRRTMVSGYYSKRRCKYMCD